MRHITITMAFGLTIKEKLARVISEYFTTQDIENGFMEAGIQIERELYAKWRIALDAFNRMSNPEEEIPSVLAIFAHPLNFSIPENRINFVEKINNILEFVGCRLEMTKNETKAISKSGTLVDIKDTKIKTSTDYVLEALNFFKNEYNKARLAGLRYEYSLGENISSDQIENGRDEYDDRLKAIAQLKNVGLVTEYEIICKYEHDTYEWDYASCKIDENKLTGKEEPKATDEAVKTLTQKVVHEHTHRFENSIQEKDIGLNHKFEEQRPKNTSKLPFKIPAGTTWESILITFNNEEAATIQVAGKSHNTGYADMGFVDKRKDTPNLQWGLLLLLARKGGLLEASDADAQQRYKKHKQLLSDRLKDYFGMQTDPMEPYNGGYKIRMTLIPPPKQPKMTQPPESGMEEFLSS